MTTESPTTSRPRWRFGWFHVVAISIIALLLAWHFGLFTRTPRLAMVTSGEGPYWDAVIAGANHAAGIYDVKVDVIRVPTKADLQSGKIRQLLAMSYDGIAVSPINPIAQAAVLADAAKATTLVTFDSDSPVAGRLCFVGTDNYAAGRSCGQLVRSALPHGGKVIVFLGNPDKENTQRRRQGVIDDLLDRPFEPDRPMDPPDQPLEGTKYTIVATYSDASEPQVAKTNAAQALKDHPDATCFVGLLAYTAPALVKALDEAGRLGKVQVVGFDCDPQTLDGIEAGHVYGTIMQDQFGCGFQTVRILAEHARGDHSSLPIFQKRTLPSERVTKNNVAAVRKQISAATKVRG